MPNPFQTIETLCKLLKIAITAIQDEALQAELQKAFDDAMGEVEQK